MRNHKILIALSCFAISQSFTSCNTFRKQQLRAEKFYNQNPDELAKICALRYPIIDSVGATIVDSIGHADNVDYQKDLNLLAKAAAGLASKVNALHADSVTSAAAIISMQSEVNTLSAELARLKDAYKPCKPETVYQTKTVYRENTARIAVLQSQIVTLATQLQEKAAQYDKLYKDYNQSVIDRDQYKDERNRTRVSLIAMSALFALTLILILRKKS